MESSRKEMRIRIGGMTCVNCQNKIESALSAMEGVVSAKVSYSGGTADMVLAENGPEPEKIYAVIEKLGYKVLSEREQGPDVIKTVCLLVIIVALYIMLQSTGVLNLLAPGRLADTEAGYGMLFVIGLITSVHCISMCGGINLSQCLPKAEGGERSGRLAAFLPALAYNFGRVLSYTAVGLVLGTVGALIGGGAEVGLSAILQGLLKIAAGILMVIMGINMLGLFPQLRIFTFRVPRFIAGKAGKVGAASGRPFVVGLLNGFMPCGPLQSMWTVALASASPFGGALSMLLFALGTVPLMLGFGSIVSALGKKFREKVMTVGAVLVVVLGLSMLAQGGALSGWLPPELLLTLVISLCVAAVLMSIPVQKRFLKNVLSTASAAVVICSCALWGFQQSSLQSVSAEGYEAELIDGVQVINSTLEPGHYPNITVEAGIPVRWVIDAPEGSVNGCNYKIFIQDYDIEYTFRTGENVIEFIPEKAGTVSYSCWMGMIRGNIFVTDGTGSTAVSGTEVTVPTPSGYEIPVGVIEVAEFSYDSAGNAVQEVSISLTDDGFSPAVLVVQRDMTVLWNIENEMTGAEEGVALLAPYYSTELFLGTGLNQIGLYPTESFEVSTGDSRFYAYIKVVDDINNFDEDAVREEISSFETLIYPHEIFESPGTSCCG